MSVVANVAINIDGKQAQSLLKAIQGEVEKLNGSFDQIPKKTGGIFDKLKGGAIAVVGKLAAVTGAAVTVKQAFDTLADQSKAEAALRTLGVDADAATQQFAQLSKELNGQASIVELTAAAYDVASAGFADVADQTSILEAATKGAVGGMSDINTVGNAVTGVLNTYGMSADNAAKLVDGFIQTQNDGKIVLAEYATQIGTLAPIASAAGVPIEELNAAIATITAKTNQVGPAFTGMRQAIAAVLKPTEQAKNEAQKLGIQFDAAALKSKGLGGFLRDVQEKTDGNATSMTTLFGSVEAYTQIVALAGDGLVKFDKNLKNQGNTAGVADKAFAEMSNTIEGALKALDTAFKNLVVAFKPVIPAIIAPFKLLAGIINTVTENIKAFAQAATFVVTFVATMKSALIIFKGIELLVKGWAIATKALGVAKAFVMTLLNPAALAQIAVGIGAATGAAVALGNAMGETGTKAEEAKGKQGGVADEITKTTGEIQKQAEALDQIPPKQQAQIDKAQEALNKLQGQKIAIDQQIASLERGASVNSARLGAEKAINNLQGQQLERQYGLAQTARQRLNIAVAIFHQQVKAAQIEYKQAIDQIRLEQQKIDLQIQQAAQQYKILEAKAAAEKIGKDDAGQAKINAQLAEALMAQEGVVAALEDQQEAQRYIAGYQFDTAEAQYNSRVLAAQTALETKLTSDNIGVSQANAVQLSNELVRGSASADNLANGTQHVATNAHAAASNFIRVATEADRAAAAISNAANQQARLNSLRSSGGGGGGKGGGSAPVKKAADGAYWQGGFKAFAKGGVVNKPTLGLIGEGGEPEYIVPESKAEAFSANYLSGARGSAAIPNGGVGSGGGGGYAGGSMSAPTISIQTGPVVQMNGQNYVTTQDMSRAVQAGVQQTLNMMRNDRGTRRAVGLA